MSNDVESKKQIDAIRNKAGEIVFRMATNYTGMEATKEAIEPLLLFTYSCVNKYNKHLYQVATGKMSFAQFDAMMQGA